MSPTCISFSDEFSQIDLYQTSQLEWHYISIFVHDDKANNTKCNEKELTRFASQKKKYIKPFQCTKYMAFLQTTKKVI